MVPGPPEPGAVVSHWGADKRRKKKPMKKYAAASLAAGIAAASLLAVAGPAQAGSDKVDICHATGSGKYVPLSVDKNAVTKQGHDTHQDGRDIIPAFSWVEDKTRYHFAGQNLDKVDLIANGCTVPAEQVPAKPQPPVYVPASCARPELPYGEVIVPADKGEGVAGASDPRLNDGKTQWSVSYALTQPTEDRVYSWPAGFDGSYRFDVVPITADPYWVTDSATGVGQCELPETGALTGALPWAGGALGLGLLAFGASKVARRRTVQQ